MLDLGQIILGVHIAASKIRRYIDLQTAIAVSQLVLKHRENKNLCRRIIVFAASALDGSGADDKVISKSLRKTNVEMG